MSRYQVRYTRQDGQHRVEDCQDRQGAAIFAARLMQTVVLLDGGVMVDHSQSCTDPTKDKMHVVLTKDGQLFGKIEAYPS